MADAKTWAERIAEWHASGLSAARFTEGRDFSAHQLWNWKSRLGKEAAAAEAKRTSGAVKQVDVRVARVVRMRRQTLALASTGAPLSLEVCGMRLVVPPGFDRVTLSAVLDEMDTRRSRQGR